MTNLEKAQAFFRNNGVGASIDDIYLYIEAYGYDVQVSQAEIDFRAELFDEQFNFNKVPLEFESSHGTLYVNEDGTIHPSSKEFISDWLLNIERVDIEELDNYLSYYDLPSAQGGDVLDFAYWDKGGVYHPPSRQWREDTFHRVSVDSDPDEAKAHWTEERIKQVIDKSYEWIKENRL